MTRSDLETVLGWARAEGWNPGLDDAEAFLAADPDGFLVACEDGAPVASISVVRVGPDHAFLGLYICRADRRGRGYGSAVWCAGLARVADLAVGLDGVVAQQANYAASGFVYLHRTIRFAGHLAAVGPGVTEPVRSEDLPELVALDRRASGLQRATFLERWFSPGPQRAVRVLRSHGRIQGLGVARRCVSGWKIGPLFADTPEAAAALLDDLGAVVEGSVMLDVPEPNGAATALARSRGLEPVFETARMWRGDPPTGEPQTVYGVATLELG